MFGLFKKKEEKHFISKTIMYKGFDVFLWADMQPEERLFFCNEYRLVFFKYGWRTNGYGEYSSGASAENLEKSMASQLENAKKYIDSVIELPSELDKAKHALENL